MVYQKDQMVKFSPAFLQRLIDTNCDPGQMYKVELRTCLNNQRQSHFCSFVEIYSMFHSRLLPTCGSLWDRYRTPYTVV